MHDDAGRDNGLMSNPPREQCETSEGGGGYCIIPSPVSIVVVHHRLEWADSTTSARRAAKEGGSPPQPRRQFLKRRRSRPERGSISTIETPTNHRFLPNGIASDSPIGHGIQPHGPAGGVADGHRHIPLGHDKQFRTSRIGRPLPLPPVLFTTPPHRVLRPPPHREVLARGTESSVRRGGQGGSRTHRRKLEEGRRGRREGERRWILACAFER